MWLLYLSLLKSLNLQPTRAPVETWSTQRISARVIAARVMARRGGRAPGCRREGGREGEEGARWSLH